MGIKIRRKCYVYKIIVDLVLLSNNIVEITHRRRKMIGTLVEVSIFLSSRRQLIYIYIYIV